MASACSTLFLFACSYASQSSVDPAGAAALTEADRMKTPTLERQFCWSCRVVGIWGEGCSLGPFSTHWLIYTVFIENSLSCFTWDDRCKKKWTTPSAGGAVVNSRWCCIRTRMRVGSAKVEWITCDDRCGMSQWWRGLNGGSTGVVGVLHRNQVLDCVEPTGWSTRVRAQLQLCTCREEGAGETWAKSDQVQMFYWRQHQVSDL